MKNKYLSTTKSKSAKRIGRGPGSGKGKTSGRGTKGQNARSRLSVTHSHFEGGQRPLIKRLPYRRGKGNPKISTKPLVVNLKDLNNFTKNETVNLDSLVKNNVVKKIDAQIYGVKILGDGEINTPLIFEISVSKNAAAKVVKAGGKIIEIKIEKKKEEENKTA